MSRDSNSQTPGEEDADDIEDPSMQDAHPEEAAQSVRQRSRVPESDLFSGIPRGPIRSLIHSITRDIYAVDEIEQELSILWHRKTWMRPLIRKPLSYLLKIARNKAVSYVKAQADRRRRFDEVTLDPHFPRRQSPDSILDIMTREKVVELFRDSLPPRLKPVLDLYIEGRGADEIAKLRNIKPTTAKSYLGAIAKRSEHFLERHMTEQSPDSPTHTRKER
jgi:DNA-directed RNA polymerase specialized sigma24 family protein